MTTEHKMTGIQTLIKWELYDGPDSEHVMSRVADMEQSVMQRFVDEQYPSEAPEFKKTVREKIVGQQECIENEPYGPCTMSKDKHVHRVLYWEEIA